MRVELVTGESRYFLTWGRTLDAVDPVPLQRLVLAAAPRFSLGADPVSAQVCPSLQDASGQPYFFECFFQMCQQPISYGADHARWAADAAQRQRAGSDIYYLGQERGG